MLVKLFRCRNCRRGLCVLADLAGRKVRCPHCRLVFRAPSNFLWWRGSAGRLAQAMYRSRN